MRLFLLNKGVDFTNKDIAKRSRVNPNTVRREVHMLKSVNFIKKRTRGYAFSNSFKYTREIESLLISADTLNKNTVIQNFKKAGRIKLIIIAGIFIKNKDSRVDLLIVGNKIKKNQVEEGVRKLEAEIGTELTYAIFNTKEFLYRLHIYDKLIWDILDFPHEVVLESKELSTQILKKP